MSREIIKEIEINEISKKIKDLFEDNNWFIQFHKRWFWATHGRKFGARLIVKKNGEIITLSIFEQHNEKPEEILFICDCPDREELNISLYEQDTGRWNEKKRKWEWDSKFARKYPEVVSRYPEPSWRNIIEASIETKNWSDLKNKIMKTIRI